jgi:hypothetical protein
LSYMRMKPIRIFDALLTVGFCIWLMTGCETTEHKPRQISVTEINTEVTKDLHFNIYKIDGCEYIGGTYYKGFYLAHKGNCQNPIHIYNKVAEKEIP